MARLVNNDFRRPKTGMTESSLKEWFSCTSFQHRIIEGRKKVKQIQVLVV